MSAEDRKRRDAALAAAEARLRGVPSAHDLEEMARQAPPVEEVWVQPTEKEDEAAKRELGRMIVRGIVRDNGYKQAADAVETLLKIAKNILDSNDPKYRSIKSSSNVLKTKVLNVKGGHEYLIAMGFRTKKADFVMTYILEPKLRRMHELRLGADVLESHLSYLQARVSQLNSSTNNHKSDEASRKAKALREIDGDRDEVRTRVEREKRSREHREKLRKEAEEKAKLEADAKAKAEAEAGDGGSQGGQGLGGPTLGRRDGDDGESEGGDDDNDDDDDMEEDAILGGGRRLGE